MENDSQSASEEGNFFLGEARDIPAGDNHFPFSGIFGAIDEFKEGGFAGSGGTDEENELPFLYSQIDIVKSFHSVGVNEGDIQHLYHTFFIISKKEDKANGDLVGSSLNKWKNKMGS